MNRCNMKSRQTGIALVVVMIFTVLLAMSGLTTMSLAVQEERLAGNIHRQMETLAAAEAGLAAARPWLDGHHAACTEGTTVDEAVFGSGLRYVVTIAACLKDGRIEVRSTAQGADGAARRVVAVVYAPPVGAVPGRYDSWREIVQP